MIGTRLRVVLELMELLMKVLGVKMVRIGMRVGLVMVTVMGMKITVLRVGMMVEIGILVRAKDCHRCCETLKKIRSINGGRKYQNTKSAKFEKWSQRFVRDFGDLWTK
jgi:hypothetical protein